MPGLPSSTIPYTHASELPQSVWNAFKSNEGAANIVLPFAMKATHFPRNNKQLWIAQFDQAGNVDFVLSCTEEEGVEGPNAKYPIFIFTPIPSEQLGPGLSDSLFPLARCLQQAVPAERVFSVFSPAVVTEEFAQIWSKCSGKAIIPEPYYDATFSFCTVDTLKGLKSSSKLLDRPELVIQTRLANEFDVVRLGVLCQEFSETSLPFRLTLEEATAEAQRLVANKEVWVHMVEEGNGTWEIASLVATTRQSEKVTAVTKVYTHKNWRGLGCAVRLLHRVCEEAFTDAMKERVVLYVGMAGPEGSNDEKDREMKAARRAYGGVGFSGLDEQPAEGEHWLERGFENTTLGHW
ncbi:hypothetical protein HYDPIDRAFT_26629 [Hydnomerulius pinastri MD-312]|nr:hypothetical protein HYDPIDRAFT_26629 [Hydnomerulius pinastri MD-312]